MECILSDVMEAIDMWLCSLSVKAEGCHRIIDIHERIRQTVQQIEYEGDSVNIDRIKFAGNIWTDIIKLMTIEEISSSAKSQILLNILKLLECGEISIDFAYHLISETFYML